MALSYTDLGYFIEIAHTGNMSRAAERLGIAQPSLSAAVKRLEDALGVTLLVRGRRGVHLTKAGTALVNRGRVLLSSWHQLKVELRKSETEVSGQYVIGCHPSVALSSLPAFLPALLGHHPQLEVKLVHDLSRKIAEGVISFEIDFGIVVNPVRHPELVIKELYSDEVSFWTGAQPAATQSLDPKSAVLICDLQLHQTQKLLRDLDRQQLGFRRVIQSSDLELIAALTASGAGVGILPKRVATRLGSQRLKPWAKNLPVFKDKICLVYRADAQKTRGSQMVIEAIRQALD